MYYEPHHIMSYNRVLNFIIGARGIGKTYAFKSVAINKFIKKGEQFIYLRRYKPELKKIRQFFDDIKEQYPNHIFQVKGGTSGAIFYINNQIAGWAIPLSSFGNEKSTPYPHVTSIIFDEFMLEKGTTHYLLNEVNNFLNFMDTVIRQRTNCQAYLLSNAISIVNPYFIYFEITPNMNKRFTTFKRWKQIVIELPPNEVVSNNLTPFQELIIDTDYASYSIENKWALDNSDFIRKKSPESRFFINIAVKGQMIGFWIDYKEGIIYASNKIDPTGLTFSLSSEEHKPNMYLIQNAKNNFYLKQIINSFIKSYLFFENQNVKQLCLHAFKIMNV